MKRKAQITIYLILGIVLVASFVIVLYLAGSATTEKLSGQKQKVITAALEASAVNYYAQICLENGLKDGLELVGKQGGVIYQEQGGLVDKDTRGYVEHNGDMVGLGIKKVNVFLPVYPCGNLSEEAPDYCRYPQEDEDYFFGQKIFPILAGGAFSIEGQLERFIVNYTQECIQDFISREIGGLAVEPGENISVNVVFSEKSTLVKMDYPLQVEVGGTEPVIQFLHWSARVNVRFKKIWEIVNDILSDDVGYIEFDVDEDIYNNTAYLPNYFYGEGIKFDLVEGEEDVLILNDTASEINGQPYIFKVARENRPPALEWINRNYSLADLYDYLVVQGEDIEMVMVAEDPDEDELKYSFVGDNALLDGSEADFTWTKSTIGIEPGYYNITARVEDLSTDQYVDHQIVRILVDNKLKANFIVRPCFEALGVITKEDPICLDAESTTGSLDPNAEFYYQWWQPFYNFSKEECLAYPGAVNCSVRDFDIMNIKEQLVRESNDQLKNSYFELRVLIDYDSNETQNSTASLWLDAQDCVNYEIASRPYPYPYHNIAPDGTEYEEKIPPFYATHACCSEQGAYEPMTTECFRKEDNVCNDGVMEKRIFKQNCSGDRGNICSGPNTTKVIKICNVICGSTHDQCSGKTPWSRLREGESCYGSNGCSKVCDKAIVDINDNNVFDSADLCGCLSGLTSPTVNLDCDYDHDGNFERVCDLSGQCSQP
ncbi:MAG: hypothetical protein KAT77_02180 [Nanoarchaeota archaeon]|nr:hypothetical protein [Nanoarchaeota archaeon]